MTRWDDFEAGVLLAAAYAIQRRDTTITGVCRRVRCRYPRMALAAYVALCVIFADHIRRGTEDV